MDQVMHKKNYTGIKAWSRIICASVCLLGGGQLAYAQTRADLGQGSTKSIDPNVVDSDGCPIGVDKTYCEISKATGGKVVVCPKGDPKAQQECIAKAMEGVFQNGPVSAQAESKKQINPGQALRETLAFNESRRNPWYQNLRWWLKIPGKVLLFVWLWSVAWLSIRIAIGGWPIGGLSKSPFNSSAQTAALAQTSDVWSVFYLPAKSLALSMAVPLGLGVLLVAMFPHGSGLLTLYSFLAAAGIIIFWFGGLICYGWIVGVEKLIDSNKKATGNRALGIFLMLKWITGAAVLLVLITGVIVGFTGPIRLVS